MHALNSGKEDILTEAHNIGSQLGLLKSFNDIAKGTNESAVKFKEQLQS